MSSAEHARKLQLTPHHPLRVGGAHDALSACLIEQAGFPAVWLSGFGVAAAQFALPDVNLVTLTESVEAASRAVARVGIPVIVDADNGFGDAMNVARAVRAYGCAGVAGICLEDNAFPKRCSLYPNAPRELVSVSEMCEKLATARRAGEPFGMMLIGRIESLIAGLGPEDALARAQAYADAGADALLIHARRFEPLRQIALSGRVTRPLVVVPTLFPEIAFGELTECGFAAVIYANQLLRAMVHAGQLALSRMARAATLAEIDSLLSPLEEMNRLVRVPGEWVAEPSSPALAGAEQRPT